MTTKDYQFIKFYYKILLEAWKKLFSFLLIASKTMHLKKSLKKFSKKKIFFRSDSKEEHFIIGSNKESVEGKLILNYYYIIVSHKLKTS